MGNAKKIAKLIVGGGIGDGDHDFSSDITAEEYEFSENAGWIFGAEKCTKCGILKGRKSPGSSGAAYDIVYKTKWNPFAGKKIPPCK